MTRKDYVLIAAALKAARDGYDYIPALEFEGSPIETALNDAAGAIAAALARDNPRFDRERFLKAAGVQS